MRKRATIVLAVLLALGGLGFVSGVAQAHQCSDKNGDGVVDTTTNSPDCEPSGVYPNWRDNVVPAFDLADRDDEQQKHDAQRWRDDNGCQKQFCVWANPSGSVDDPEGPATIHAGMAGEHALGEAAHSDEGHDESEFGNHDTHGGTIYADVCLGTDNGTTFEGKAGACSDAMDSEVGIVIVDHLTCPMGCADEYHVIRPTDPAYTQEQMSDSQRDAGEIAADPKRWACGYEEQGSACY